LHRPDDEVWAVKDNRRLTSRDVYTVISAWNAPFRVLIV
jgi:hypothetical protein